jgi:hypothetical protein
MAKRNVGCPPHSPDLSALRLLTVRGFKEYYVHQKTKNTAGPEVQNGKFASFTTPPVTLQKVSHFVARYYQ